MLLYGICYWKYDIGVVYYWEVYIQDFCEMMMFWRQIGCVNIDRMGGDGEDVYVYYGILLISEEELNLCKCKFVVD